MCNRLDAEAAEVLRAMRAQFLHEVPALDDDMTIAVLLCDDHPTFVLAALLADEGAAIEVVGIASGGAEVERMVRELRPDVVLMDIRMPDVDGIEATRRIRSISPTTRVVLLTVGDDEVEFYRAVRAGVSGFLAKDSDPHLVQTAVRSVAFGGTFVDPSLAGKLVASARREGLL